ncbi:MAG: polysaccharide deacetylase family protein [Nitrosopumilus sp.]|nr:polysaccharide deacetylase family protein [Nitrosopumilus sp.]
MKLLMIFLGVFCGFSISPFIHAEVYEGRINYLDPEFEKMIPSEICNCVAFRFDDIQNYWLHDVQLEVLETFRENNIPVTIGIIGNDFDGDMANYIKNVTSSENSNFEIANHGWTHENFAVLDKDQQNQLIKNTNKRIFNVTGILPETFIPPMGEINNGTIEVLQENNFTTFSGLMLTSPPPYPLVISGAHHFPETALTAVYKAESQIFQGLPHSETLKDIQQSQKKFGFSVIALHPQDFAVIENGIHVNKINQDQIHELVLLIEEIQKSDLKIVFLNQISENLTKNLEYQETKSSNSNPTNNGGCLIATAAYGSEIAPQVQQLRELRDNQLLQTESGSAFMKSFNEFYYSFSPTVADYEREHPIFKEAVKLAITPMISSLLILDYVDLDSEEKVLSFGISLILLNVGMYLGIPLAAIIGIKKRI